LVERGLGHQEQVLTFYVAIQNKGHWELWIRPIRVGVDTLLISKITQAPLFRFLAVGGAAFVLDAGVVWGLTQLGLSAYVGRGLSLCVSVVFTFILNRRATFRAQGPVKASEVVAYIGASGLGIAINYAVFAACLALGLKWLPAMGLGTVIASAFNFVAYGRIFKK
jgi:putative flippase GtrA